jgi:hypothetical protein
VRRAAALARIHRTAIMPVTIAVTKTKTSIRPLARDTRAGPGQYPLNNHRWQSLVWLGNCFQGQGGMLKIPETTTIRRRGGHRKEPAGKNFDAESTRAEITFEILKIYPRAFCSQLQQFGAGLRSFVS